jgi:anti-anti-sigma factor
MPPFPPGRRSGVTSTAPLRVTGYQLTRDASCLLRAAAATRIESGQSQLVVDLRGVVYVDMEGVGTLFHLWRSTTAHGGSLRVVNVGTRALTRLRIAGLPRFTAVEAATEADR